MAFSTLRINVLLLAVCLSASPVWAERNVLLRLDYSFRTGNASTLPSDAALKALAGPEADQARGIVRHVFEVNWISGQGKLTLEHLNQAAGPVRAFGEGNQELPALVIGGGSLPAAHDDDKFIKWLRGALPNDSVRTELLPALGKVPQGSTTVVERLRFLQQVARDGERAAVMGHFDSTYWRPAPVDDSAVYFNALAENPLAGWENIRTQLAEQVNAKPITEWSEAGDTLVPMARVTRAGVSGFLRKAADRLRGTPDDRSEGTADVLTRLAVAGQASEGAQTVGLTEATCALEWFVWCHGRKEMIAHFLKNSAAARAMAARLVTFCAPDDDVTFGKLFDLVRDPYYATKDVRDVIFETLLAPKVRKAGEGARLTLEAALAGGWTTEHRHQLGLTVLPLGREDEPAWEKAAKTRLQTADTLYQNLDEEDAQQHVERPLLERVLKAHLAKFIKASDAGNDPGVDLAEGALTPLIDHLRVYQGRGANLSASGPLKEFRTRLATSATEVFDNLSAQASHQEPVRRFVRRFKLALRVDRLVAKAHSRAGKEPPPWVRTVCGGLRTKVFGLPDDLDGEAAQKPGGPVVRWDAQLVQFRSDILCEIALDQDFRTVLGESSLEDLVFKEIMIPLVRVVGLVEGLQKRPSPPHPVWCGKETVRWTMVFAALDCAESLESPSAVKAFATLHLGSLGVNSPWLAEPKQIFAGRWSVNATFPVFRTLLTDTLPEAAAVKSKSCDLRGLAGLAVEKWTALPEGIASEAAGWIEHLISAAEWQDHPFVPIRGEALKWENPVGTAHDRPFLFEFPEKARFGSRRVDGTLRLAFTKRLVALTAGSHSVSELELLADSGSLLPNSPANDATSDKGRAGDEVKVAAARLVHAGLPGIGEDRVRLLRAYMRLGAALTRPASVASDPQGGLPRELPPALTLLTTGPDAGSLEMASLREELRRLLLSRENNPGLTPEDLIRRDIDGMLGTTEKDGSLLNRSWRTTDRDLRARDFGSRLLQVGEPTVRDFLRLRRSMVQLMGLFEPLPAQTQEAQKEKQSSAATKETATKASAERPHAMPSPDDAGRVQRFFGYIDWIIFYSRPDWKLNNDYLAHEKHEPQPWWPALTILCAATPELQSTVVQFADAVPVEVGRPHLLDLFRLNEAAIGIIDEIVADKARAAERLSFVHELRWTELDLRLLARAEHFDRADARTLAANAFSGAVLNVAMAARFQASPNDAAMEGRLKISLDAGFPDSERRREPVISLDRTVRLAALCAEDTSLPAMLRQAAPRLSDAAKAMPGNGLLGGAATPGKVVDVLFWLHDKSAAEPSAFYRKFYDDALTEGPRLAPAVHRALAEPFFAQPAPGQRSGIDSIADRWRAVAAVPPPPHPSQLVSACRMSWGPVINRLLKGKDRKSPAQPYLWQTVEALEAASQPDADSPVLAEPPTDFMTLASWLQGQWRDDDPPAVRDFFNPLGGTPAPAKETAAQRR